MSYQPPKGKKKAKPIHTLCFRLPKDIIQPFNDIINSNGLTGQQLTESMMRHCLGEMKEREDAKWVGQDIRLLAGIGAAANG